MGRAQGRVDLRLWMVRVDDGPTAAPGRLTAGSDAWFLRPRILSREDRTAAPVRWSAQWDSGRRKALSGSGRSLMPERPDIPVTPRSIRSSTPPGRAGRGAVLSLLGGGTRDGAAGP